MDPASSRRPGTPAIFVEETGWRRVVPGCAGIVARAARLAGGAGSVVLTSDRAVKALNARHRGRNAPTNVLSFEAPAPGMAGDVVLALGTVAREARAARRPVAHHLAHLVVHGCLHLQGHDHQHAGEARRMEMTEARLLARLRIPNPWRRP
jgi:probable rRNA maturation factor